jgi:hypothetical protein
MLIESSTVTNCSPVVCMSRSLRPSVGRISAVSPQTTCERLSLVETCAANRHWRMAYSVSALSGVARTKLPTVFVSAVRRSGVCSNEYCIACVTAGTPGGPLLGRRHF